MQPRFLQLRPPARLKLQQLRREADREGAYRVARRIHAVILNSQGKTSGQIASLLDAPRSKVSEWMQLYEHHGFDALLEGRRSGRPSGLSEQQRVILGDIIESGPVAYGLDSGIWTSPMIVRVVEEEFGVRYHPGHIRKLLHQLEFSVQRPRRILAKANKEDQNRWTRYTYPRIKKKRP